MRLNQLHKNINLKNPSTWLSSTKQRLFKAKLKIENLVNEIPINVDLRRVTIIVLFSTSRDIVFMTWILITKSQRSNISAVPRHTLNSRQLWKLNAYLGAKVCWAYARGKHTPYLCITWHNFLWMACKSNVYLRCKGLLGLGMRQAHAFYMYDTMEFAVDGPTS